MLNECGAMLLVGVLASGVRANESPFKVTCKRDSDRVTITADKEQAIFAINSPTGISEAVITRKGDRWPARVILRMSLRGLEFFQVENGKTKLSASVSSTGGELRVWKDDRENERLAADDPLRLDVRRVERDGKPVEITLPKAFLKENPESITVRWIDFYRN